MFDTQVVSYYSVWVVNTLYVVALIPQIMLNYRIKTVQGISNLMLYAYTLGYFSYWYHVLFADKKFPLPYNIAIPLGIMGLLTIVFQTFYYNGIKNREILFWAYIVLFVMAVVSFLVGIQYKDEFSKICGWVYLLMSFLNVFPQGIKIIREKTVRGFSFLFVTLFTAGVFIEFIAAIILGLSLPVILNAVKGLVVYVIFCVLFYMYKDNR